MNHELILKFKDFLIYNKKFSSNTVNSYMRDIKKINKHISDTNIIEWIQLEDKIKIYFDVLKNNNYSNSTLSRTMSTINLFITFLYYNKYIDKNIKLEIKIDTQEKKEKLLEIFSRDEINEILNFSGDNFLNLRDKAIFELVYAIGIKPSECINLLVSDINLEIGYLKYKNNKDKNIITALNKSSIMALKNYINKRNELSFDNIYLFLSSNGENISRQGFWKIFKKRQKNLKLKKELNPTTYRNSLAVHLLEDGISPAIVKDLLGLKSIVSLKSYINKNNSNISMRKAIENHPRNKMKE